MLRRVLAAPALALALTAQAPLPTRPSFDAASVKVNTSGDVRTSIRILPGGHIEARNRTLALLIQSAFTLQDFQVIGGPNWLNSARFDITTRGADRQITQNDLRAMLQTLLADRFKLAVHHETREFSIYALKLDRADGRLGPAIRKPDADCFIGRGAPPPQPQPGDSRPLVCGFTESSGDLAARGVDMATLAIELTAYADRAVVDQTGLKGNFNLSLKWAPEGAPADANLPSIFTAVREQLGLKLESTKGPVDVLVIDRVEKPAAD
jgi:uncharacterized protein (TIGR03435 family)